jgi:hypothetical protein
MPKPKYASRREFLLRATPVEYDDQWSRRELVREAVESAELEGQEIETEDCPDLYELVTLGLEASWYPFPPDEGEDA